jgi:hypothetical protein
MGRKIEEKFWVIFVTFFFFKRMTTRLIHEQITRKLKKCPEVTIPVSLTFFRQIANKNKTTLV